VQTPPNAANLTQQFYALHGKEYLIRQQLISEWKDLLKLPDQEQTLEKGAILIAQWMRPCHCPGSSDIALQLDSIAEMVAVHLVGGATHEEGEGEVRDTKRVRWSALARVKEEGSHSVDERLTAINSVMYDQLGYKGAGEAYYDLDNSFIDRVLERRTGIPITLCVIYEAVARRLGVHLHPVNFPQHFVLQITPGKNGPRPHPDRCIIDAYFRGQWLTLNELNSRTFGRAAVPRVTVQARPMEVYARFLNNISLLVNRMNIERVIHTASGEWLPIPLLSYLYLRTLLLHLENNSFIALQQRQHDISTCIELQYNPRQVLSVVEPATPCTPQKVLYPEIFPMKLREMVAVREAMMGKAPGQKRRPITTNVKFSVGMVMKHKRYHYRCVIYGWDEKCVQSEDWIAQMRVDQHPPGRHQPYYNVLAHDGSNRYAAQVNLMECPSDEMGPIPHWEVGKYFTRFTVKKYIPNAPLKEVYPDDP
jgi:F-box protein 21